MGKTGLAPQRERRCLSQLFPWVLVNRHSAISFQLSTVGKTGLAPQRERRCLSQLFPWVLVNRHSAIGNRQSRVAHSASPHPFRRHTPFARRRHVTAFATPAYPRLPVSGGQVANASWAGRKITKITKGITGRQISAVKSFSFCRPFLH